MKLNIWRGKILRKSSDLKLETRVMCPTKKETKRPFDGPNTKSNCQSNSMIEETSGGFRGNNNYRWNPNSKESETKLFQKRKPLPKPPEKRMTDGEEWTVWETRGRDVVYWSYYRDVLWPTVSSETRKIERRGSHL